MSGVDLSLADIALGTAVKPLRVTQFELFGEAKVSQFERKAGFAFVPDYYALDSIDGATMGADPSQVIDLTSRMRPDGRLAWTPPAGTWRVVRLGWSLLGTTNHPATLEATGLEVDKFDAAAVRRYMEHYLGLYRQAVGPDAMGARGITAIQTDSIEVGATNWTPRLLEQFKRLRGYDPTPYLPALTGGLIGSRAQSDRFLYDYRRTLADLIASEHYGTVAKVAREHGLTIYGEALENGRPQIGDDMTMRSHTDVPMAAMWTYPRDEQATPSFVADIKGAASVAHIYGQNLVAAESMTSALNPWAYAPKDLRRVIDLEFVLGVNRPFIHTSVHVPVEDKQPGLSLSIFGQFFNRNESWSEMAKPWMDYMARSSFLLQQGRNFADIAYFYGEKTPLTTLYRDRLVQDAPNRYAYDFVGTDALIGKLSAEGTEIVAAGGARYRALYLGGSSRRMTLATLKRLHQLAEAGATIIGQAPEGSPSLNDDPEEYRRIVSTLWSAKAETRVGRGQVIPSRDVEGVLAKMGVVPDFAYSSSQSDGEVLFTHRRLNDGDIYFLSNRRNRPDRVHAVFRVSGKVPEIWRADTGSMEPVSYQASGETTEVTLYFEAEESYFVVFWTPAGGTQAIVDRPVLQTVATIDGAWEVSFQPGRGAPDRTTLQGLSSLSRHSDAGIRYFSGVASYIKSFNPPASYRPGQPLKLDLGDVGDIAEVLVNGRAAGTVWHAPWTIDIGALTTTGENRLEIHVANTWVNRLIGDAQPGARKLTFTSIPTYNADAPLQPAGLLGPVRILMPHASAIGPVQVTTPRSEVNRSGHVRFPASLQFRQLRKLQDRQEMKSTFGSSFLFRQDNPSAGCPTALQAPKRYLQP